MAKATKATTKAAPVKATKLGNAITATKAAIANSIKPKTAPVKATTQRDVAADLLGGTRKGSKAAPVKATKATDLLGIKAALAASTSKAAPVKGKAAPVKARTPNTAKIKIIEAPGHREGSNCAFIWSLIKNGMTVEQYRAAREKLVRNPRTKQEMPGSGMAYLGGLVRAGKIKLVA